MKSIFLVLGLALLTLSCNKMKDFHLFGKKRHHVTCPIVDVKNVPTATTTAFNTRYSRAASITWFQKGVNYCAVFMNDNVQTKSIFDANGNFISEHVKGHHKGGECGKHEDDDDRDEANECECRIDNDGDDR